MDKTPQGDDNDIATQNYKGPGSLVTGAGEGAIAHYGTGLAGLVGGSIASFFGYKMVNKWEDGLSRFHANNVNNTNIFTRGTAKALNKVREWSHHAGHGMSKLKMLSGVSPQKMDAMVFGGGLLGVFGFFVAPLYFFVTGAKHSNAGKVQFREAQDEIITIRAERDALLEKYAEVKTELDTVKATGGNDATLKVAKDNPPAVDAPHQESIAALSGVEQDSPTEPTPPTIGPAPTTGKTLPGEPPRIKEPVIGPEHAPANKIDSAVLADRVAETNFAQEAARV